MKKLLVIAIFLISLAPMDLHASSEDECAIWLCLPGGFPQGCEAAHSAMVKRIKKKKPPLPNLSSCGGGDGSYTMGIEYFHPCETGYDLVELNQDGRNFGSCFRENCTPDMNSLIVRDNQIGYRDEYDGGGYSRCEHHEAERRVKPSFIEMWINGGYIGKFFYQ